MLIKKLDQMHAVMLSIEDNFKGSNKKKPVPDAYATPAANGLLVRLIRSIEKTRNGQGAFQSHNGAPKHGISGYFYRCFKLFSSLRTFGFTFTKPTYSHVHLAKFNAQINLRYFPLRSEYSLAA